jgi:hypothetical protein
MRGRFGFRFGFSAAPRNEMKRQLETADFAICTRGRRSFSGLGFSGQLQKSREMVAHSRVALNFAIIRAVASSVSLVWAFPQLPGKPRSGKITKHGTERHAAAAGIPDGAYLALPPDYSLVAMDVVRALLRRGARDLRLLGVPVLGISADLLIGAGCVASVGERRVIGEATSAGFTGQPSRRGRN